MGSIKGGIKAMEIGNQMAGASAGGKSAPGRAHFVPIDDRARSDLEQLLGLRTHVEPEDARA